MSKIVTYGDYEWMTLESGALMLATSPHEGNFYLALKESDSFCKAGIMLFFNKKTGSFQFVSNLMNTTCDYAIVEPK